MLNFESFWELTGRIPWLQLQQSPNSSDRRCARIHLIAHLLLDAFSFPLCSCSTRCFCMSPVSTWRAIATGAPRQVPVSCTVQIVQGISNACSPMLLAALRCKRPLSMRGIAMWAAMLPSFLIPPAASKRMVRNFACRHAIHLCYMCYPLPRTCVPPLCRRSCKMCYDKQKMALHSWSCLSIDKHRLLLPRQQNSTYPVLVT